MRNLLAFAAAAVLGFFVVGWYLNWYKVETSKLPSGHRDVHIDLNVGKVEQDVKKLGQAAKSLEHGKEQVDTSIKTSATKPLDNQ